MLNTPSHGLIGEGGFTMRFDVVEKWLRDNDPQYGRSCYLTLDRFNKVQRREIPVSPQIMDEREEAVSNA